MNQVFCQHLNMRTISELNCYDHWTKRSKRHREQKYAVWKAYMSKRPKVGFPCVIILTRYSPRQLDFDNLVASFKWILDQVCDCITPGLAVGRADSNPNLNVQYRQEKRKNYGIQIEIYC